MQKNLFEFIQKVVKSELHLHLEGCIRVDTLWQLYQKNNIRIDGISCKKDLEQFYNIESLEQFIYFFINILQNCFRSAEDIQYYFVDLKDYLQRNNIRYAELFFSPTKLIQFQVSYADIIAALEQGVAKLANEGYICKFLIDVSRSFGPDNAMNNLNNVLAYPSPVVIGIGLGGNERIGPARDYKHVFAKAKKNNLRCVAHAGEDLNSESIWDSIEFLNVERIGHGISAMYDPSLRRRIKEAHIPIEICITSNLFTRNFVSKAVEHPVRLFYEEGLPLTLNSDDPLLFCSELHEEYELLSRDCGFKAVEILSIMENNVMMSFMPEEHKAPFIQDIRNTAREFKII